MRRRTLGRCVRWEQDPASKVVTAYFESGVARMYSEQEIADHVVAIAELALEDPAKVSEPWYEFLRDVVGEQVMVATIAHVATLAKEVA